MPLIKIELCSGKTPEFRQQMISVIGDVIVKDLALPDDDRNIRLLEYDEKNFTMKNPYEILIEITLFKGRTTETKKELYKKIVDAFEDKLKISRDKVFIVLNEQPLENWGVRGGVSATDIKFDFQINR